VEGSSKERRKGAFLIWNTPCSAIIPVRKEGHKDRRHFSYMV